MCFVVLDFVCSQGLCKLFTVLIGQRLVLLLVGYVCIVSSGAVHAPVMWV